MSVNARASKYSESTDETSVKFLQAVVDCVCVVGTTRLVGFRTTINPQVSPRTTMNQCLGPEITLERGLKLTNSGDRIISESIMVVSKVTLKSRNSIIVTWTRFDARRFV
ncbi:hypothetical protein AVEN_60103-1 [Araneus ventricosus]|uniref:Uncharacterized protein n=1 Tax=Araneus ventricosus TaxID=182803 RepID=A0A4Y2J8X8_ARAVE|nr:hypothetical protein AVEN_60103-1 [Araneus ventricosus]